MSDISQIKPDTKIPITFTLFQFPVPGGLPTWLPGNAVGERGGWTFNPVGKNAGQVLATNPTP